MGLRWYCARTTPLAEYLAREHLKSAGLEVFLPCGHTRTPRHGHQDAPLFPGYLFLRYDLDAQGWAPLNRVPQVVGLVAFGGEAPPVPDEVIDELAQRVDAMNGKGSLWTRFQRGQALGPMESLAEVVEEAKSPRARVRVLVEFLGRLVEAEVPWIDVQAVGSDQPTGNLDWQPRRRTRGRGRWIRGYGARAVVGSSGLPGAPDNGYSSS